MANAIKDTYHLSTSDDLVILELKINDTQHSLTKVLISGVEIAEHSNSFKKELGTNEELNNKELELVITCKDISEKTNKIAVTILLAGGHIQRNWTLSRVVTDSGKCNFYLLIDLND